MKAIQLLIDSELPDDLRDPTRTYDAKSVGKLMTEVARRYPDKYEDIAQKISNIGRRASYWQGETLRLSDLRPVLDKAPILAKMDAEIAEARAEATSDEDFKRERNQIWTDYSDKLEKLTQAAALKQGNNLAYAVMSGARGKPAQLKAMLTTPGIFADHQGNTIPMFVRNSYSEGLRPAEYLASTFGARSTVVSTKSCLQKGTLVLKANGEECPIEDICVGDLVMGSDLQGRLSPVKVLRIIDQGLQEVWKNVFRISNGKETISENATDDHKILANTTRKFYANATAARRGKAKKDISTYHHKSVEVLGLQARLCAVLPDAYLDSSGIKEPWALLLGLLAGDGCTTQKNVQFSCADPVLICDISNYLETLSLKISKNKGENYTWRVTTLNYTPRMHGGARKGIQDFVKTGASVPLTRKMEETGCSGKYAHEKDLPKNIWAWDIESTSSFLAGLYATDGSFFVVENKLGRRQISLSYASTSEKLLRGVKKLLLFKFGIPTAGVHWTDDGGFGGGKRKHRIYTFKISQVQAVRKFSERIHVIPGVKRARLQELLAQIEVKQQNPYGKARRIRKEYQGMQPCFDLEVDHPDHLFVLASGLIVSNSTAKGGDLGKISVQAAAPLVVTTKDCGVYNGVELPVDDQSSRGRVLAREAGDLPAGTVLDRQALSYLHDHKIDNVVARSTMTCQAKEGVCAKCCGQWAGKFPSIGSSVGVTAAHALTEPITQMALNCLVDDTLVRMADFSVKKLSDIQIGDWVMGADITGKIFPVKVTAKWDQGEQPVQEYRFELPEQPKPILLESTASHVVLAVVTGENQKIPVGEAGAAQLIVLTTPEGATAVALRSSITELGIKHCFDISVDHPDELFVLANGLIVKNSKHQGGMASGKKEFSGFDAISQFTASPETFPDRAAVAEQDGKVTRVEEAPQGGHFVFVGDESHYVLPGFAVTVRPGETVEAGDALSDGLMDPGDVVRLRGIGEGRLYYTERLSKILGDSGMPADRRNVEMMARAALNHVVVEDPDGLGDYLPDDVANYSRLASSYIPPATAKSFAPPEAVGKFLQSPALHYTIGTRITARVAAHLDKAKFGTILADDTAPGFRPEMTNLRTASQHNPDWMARLHTSYLRKNLNDSAVRGADTLVSGNVHFAPPLAHGVGFAEDIETTGHF